MNTSSISLVSILNPPLNPWLKALSRRQQKNLPQCVRVVRFSQLDIDDEEGIVIPKSGPAKRRSDARRT